MIQKHKILISLTGATTPINSTLQNVNGYSVNLIQGLGGGIVNYSNVRNFLNNENNLIIINDFYAYLTGATTQIEFIEIYNSDKKLSDVFNNYYNSSVVNNQFPPSDTIEQSLVGTTGVTVVENHMFTYDGVAPAKGLQSIPLSINNTERKLRVFSALTTFTYEPSYYIPVFVRRSHSQTDRARVYFDNIMKEINEFIPELGGDNTGNDYSYYGGEIVPNDYGGDIIIEETPFTPPQDFFEGAGTTGEIQAEVNLGGGTTTGTTGTGTTGEVKLTK
jgi:hypothetical protein